MKKLIEDNYKSIVNRGLITTDTTHHDFIHKLYEEVNELEDATRYKELKEELSDVILVCLNYAKHYRIDIEKELKNKIRINWTR